MDIPSFRCLPILAAITFGSLSLGYGQATITVTTAASNANGATSNVSGVTTATFNEVNPLLFYGTGGTALAPTSTYVSPTSTNGTLTISGFSNTSGTTPGSFVSSSVSGQYSAPTGDTSTYLAIGGTGRAGPLTLTFSNAATNYFGLDWASPDNYNSITLTFANKTTATFTPGMSYGGVAIPTVTDSFVSFYSTTPSNAITQVQLTSTQAAFELDNITYGVVPEPATWLAGGGLLAAAALALRRRLSPHAQAA